MPLPAQLEHLRAGRWPKRVSSLDLAPPDAESRESGQERLIIRLIGGCTCTTVRVPITTAQSSSESVGSNRPSGVPKRMRVQYACIRIQCALSFARVCMHVETETSEAEGSLFVSLAAI